MWDDVGSSAPRCSPRRSGPTFCWRSLKEWCDAMAPREGNITLWHATLLQWSAMLKDQIYRITFSASWNILKHRLVPEQVGKWNMWEHTPDVWKTLKASRTDVCVPVASPKGVLAVLQHVVTIYICGKGWKRTIIHSCQARLNSEPRGDSYHWRKSCPHRHCRHAWCQIVWVYDFIQGHFVHSKRKGEASSIRSTGWYTDIYSTKEACYWDKTKRLAKHRITRLSLHTGAAGAFRLLEKSFFFSLDGNIFERDPSGTLTWQSESLIYNHL